MSTYTVEQLCDQGKPFAMAMLLRALRSGEPFVTYGAIKDELQHQLGIKTIFPTQIGSVAGTLMNDILEKGPKAPLLNVLVTRSNGIPGIGAANYLANRYRDERLRSWDKINNKEKLAIVERERKKIFAYPHWDKIAADLYGKAKARRVREPQGNEYDFNASGGRGGEAESPEHKRLKEWVSKNLGKIGIPTPLQSIEVEAKLLSGDEIDVLFSNGTSFYTVEVKSCRSNEADYKRGIYQCVKYREVKIAEQAPYEIDIETILVTEGELSRELAERAKLLGVVWKQVTIR
jgi:hypothetical protein